MVVAEAVLYSIPDWLTFLSAFFARFLLGRVCRVEEDSCFWIISVSVSFFWVSGRPRLFFLMTVAVGASVGVGADMHAHVCTVRQVLIW